jgi:hypothetical protein
MDDDEDILRLRMLVQLALQETNLERYRMLVEDFNQLLLAKLMPPKRRSRKSRVESAQQGCTDVVGPSDITS